MATPLLAVDGLDVTIATRRGRLSAVRGASFSIEAGETLCLVGESGCGKSMTALALMDLLPKGAVRRVERFIFDGNDLKSASRQHINSLRGTRMAMIFQEPMSALNPVYTIGEQMIEGYRFHRHVNAQTARERAIFLLDKVGIPASSGRLEQYPHQLSGGLRQRVMIAMALMCEPKLLIADEPTTALDVTIQAQILHLLADLQREFGIALLLITHDLGVVARIATRVAVMYGGEIVEDASSERLFARPRHPYTRGLMACIPVPGRSERGQRLGTIAGTVPSLIGNIEGCAFRSRCVQAVAHCADAVPLNAMDDHLWRCHVETAR